MTVERREAFAAESLKGLKIRLQWACVTLTCSNVEQFEVEITGTDCEKDIGCVSVKVENGVLSVAQPASFPAWFGVRTKMHVRIFIPTFWKGEIDAKTISGTVEAMGLRGTDISLTTVSGALHAASIEAICLKCASVSGQLHTDDTACETLKLQTASGSIHANACDFRTASLHSVSGSCTLQAAGTFDDVMAATVSGHITLELPFAAADAVFRSTSGRIRTVGIDLVEGAPRVRAHTVSGNFIIINNDSNQENDHI